MAEGIGMAKSTATKSKKYDEWEVRDAMHTMLRAGEIVQDKTLMGHVRKQAKEHAAKKADEAERARRLAKAGKISDKAMAKMGGRMSGDTQSADGLDKMTPVA